MKVTREVITDLLPLYRSNEASNDTRELVKSFLAQDPEFAKLVNAELTVTFPIQSLTTITKEEEMRTLEKTKQLFRKRNTFLNVAILLTCFTVAFKFDSTGVRWFWADAPQGAIACALFGLICWFGYFTIRRRLRTTGV